MTRSLASLIPGMFAALSLAVASSASLHADSAWCKVGQPNNRSEPGTRQGSVAYAFEIMETEVTNAEYCEFLNAVATRHDPFRLYTPLMESHFWGGILRTRNADGTWAYACKQGYATRPVVFVSWFDAIRFINWLHYGKPASGVCVPGTTEGDAEHGAYDTRDFPHPRRSASSAKRRSAQARFWLPSADEWLKAAFYDAGGRWWKYPTRSDSCPVSQAPAESQGPSANYYGKGWAAPSPHLLPVKSYTSSAGPWGTYDQGGNVAEWVEDLIADDRGFRKALGGSLFRHANSLEMSFFEGDGPDKKLSTFGFRVARTGTPGAAPKLPGIQAGVAPVPEASSPVAADYVVIGDPGNPPDVFYGRHGAVPCSFEMARCELTNQEYATFLNAVARKADPYALYCVEQGTGILGGIDRTTRADGSFSYTAKPGWERRPVVYISWYSLARYANWLHFECPDQGVATLGTTEGDAGQGAYDTRLFEQVRSGAIAVPGNFGKRSASARYWIPSEDEWYKAAYYDPTRMGPRPYWDFPTRTDNIPDNPPAPGGAHGMNYQRGDALAEGPPYYLAEVDGYARASSYYGTLQQGGNVWEWVEGWHSGIVGLHALRGGSFGYTEIGPHAQNCDLGGLDEKSYVFGARLARKASKPLVAPSPSMLSRARQHLDRLSPRDWLIYCGLLMAGTAVSCCAATVLALKFLRRRKSL